MYDLVSPWHPMNDPVDLKITGKAMEELSECISAIARCQIQGICECEPMTGKMNREWLQEEMGDVLAQFKHLIEQFQLDGDAIQSRANIKYERTARWHKMA